MQPIPEKIHKPSNQSFYYKIVEEPFFSAPWHAHSEIEIFLVLDGEGTRYVGDGIGHFGSGDLAIIGSNTPHIWSSGDNYHESTNTKLSKGICIQFNKLFLGRQFTELPELTLINEFLLKSKRGIKFFGQTRSILHEKLIQLPEHLGMKRLILFLEILEIMSTTKEYDFLSSPNYSSINIKTEDLERIEKIYQFVLKNYNTNIQIEEVAKLINLSPQSFCRYFKSRTNKVFSTFLNEVRIGHACALLIENKYNVAQICYETGFNHLSNFNRQFKKIKGLTPSQFQNEYRSGVSINKE